MDTIRFELNARPVSWEGQASARLLDTLRRDFSCLSVKCGCGEGECGACAVLVDGRLINSCCVAMGAVDGKAILTLEGFRETPQFAALNRAFADFSAVQCGFCTPGMVLAAHALLTARPHPSEAEIREGLSGNLCRCTGYNAIVNAVKAAAKEGLW